MTEFPIKVHRELESSGDKYVIVSAEDIISECGDIFSFMEILQGIDNYEPILLRDNDPEYNESKGIYFIIHPGAIVSHEIEGKAILVVEDISELKDYLRTGPNVVRL